MKGISNERGCKCKQHQFILRPLTENLNHSLKVQLSMCQGPSKKLKKKVLSSKRKCCFGFSILNTDKNYATPAFILQSQKEHFLENRNNYIKDHTRKIRQYEQVASDLYFPAPRSNYEYCNVCCVSFTDYIQHISSFEHHQQIKLTKSNGYILDLEKTFKKKQSQENRKRSLEDRMILIDDDSQLSSSAQKKLKTDEKTQMTQNNVVFSQNGLPQFKNYYHFNNYMLANPIINCQNAQTQEKINQHQKITFFDCLQKYTLQRSQQFLNAMTPQALNPYLFMGQRNTKNNLNHPCNMYQTYPEAQQGRKNTSQYDFPVINQVNQYNPYVTPMNRQLYYSPPYCIPPMYVNQAPFCQNPSNNFGQSQNNQLHYQMPVAPNTYFCFNNLNIPTFTW